jgi:hypothetical protein
MYRGENTSIRNNGRKTGILIPSPAKSQERQEGRRKARNVNGQFAGVCPDRQFSPSQILTKKALPEIRQGLM